MDEATKRCERLKIMTMGGLISQSAAEQIDDLNKFIAEQVQQRIIELVDSRSAMLNFNKHEQLIFMCVTLKTCAATLTHGLEAITAHTVERALRSKVQ